MPLIDMAGVALAAGLTVVWRLRVWRQHDHRRRVARLRARRLGGES